MSKNNLFLITALFVFLLFASCDSVSDSNVIEPDATISSQSVDKQNITGTNYYTIYPGDLQGWGFSAETGDGTGSLVNGPGTPPLGTGSANLVVDSGDDGAVFGKGGYVGKRLDEITTLQYSTYRTTGADALVIALQINVDDDVTDTDDSWKGRLVFEPYYSETVVTGAWQTWNTLSEGRWWGSGAPINTVCSISSPCTWDEILTAFPDAGFNSSFGGLLFKAGSGWDAFDGNVDGFIIGDADGSDTYDFEFEEPILNPETKDDCKQGGWEDFDFKNQGQCIRYVNTRKDSR